MMLGVVDYAASLFKFKTLTPIQGTPTNKTLKQLTAELRVNMNSVATDLGGHSYGYLGFVLDNVE